MKFSFKIQQYQTDAVEAVARIFQGQPYSAGVSYMRDIGTSQDAGAQLYLLPAENNDSGFKNEALQLTDEQILRNIQALQNESNIHQSSQLVAPMGRCSLDIEMENGQDLRLHQDPVRVEQALWLEQVHRCGSEHRHP